MEYIVKIKNGSLSSTGIVIDKTQGLVITNSHCIQDSSPMVILQDDTHLRANVIAKSQNIEAGLDICLL